MRKLLFWIGTLFIPYVLVVFVWIRRKFGKAGRIIYTAWAAIVLVIGIAGAANGNSPASIPSSATTNTTAATTPTTNTTSTAPRETALDPVTNLQHIVAGSIDKSLFESVDVNTYGGTDPYGKDKYLLEIHMKAQDGFNTNQSMQWTVMDVQQASKQIFTKSKLVYEADFFIDTKLVDKYGHTSTGEWCRITLMGKDGYRINYDNLDASGFAQLLDFQGFTQDSKTAFQTLVNGN